MRYELTTSCACSFTCALQYKLQVVFYETLSLWPPPGFPHCAQVLCKTWKDAGQNYLQPSSSLPWRFCSATALLGELPFSVSPETQPSSGCASKERGGCLKQSGGAAFNFPFLPSWKSCWSVRRVQWGAPPAGAGRALRIASCGSRRGGGARSAPCAQPAAAPPNSRPKSKVQGRGLFKSGTWLLSTSSVTHTAPLVLLFYFRCPWATSQAIVASEKQGWVSDTCLEILGTIFILFLTAQDGIYP